MAEAPQSFSRFERVGWEEVSADYHASFQALTKQSIPALLDAVGAEPGARLLDLCSGPGYVAAAAAERGADVVGMDFSSAMIDLARDLHPAVEFRQGDAEELSFDAESFDAVTINYGILHLAHPERALERAHRVLAPGGRIASAVWAVPERAIGFGLVLAAVRAYGRLDVDLPSGPDFFRFSEAEECRRTFEAAGFTDVRSEEVSQTWTVRGPDDVLRAMLEGTVRTRALLAAQSSTALEAIRTAVGVSVERFRVGEVSELATPAFLTHATKSDTEPVA